MNNVNLIGRLTKDPELRTTQSGLSVCSFSIAVDRGAKKESGEKITDFIPCTAWKTTADNITKYFFKGSRIGVTGMLIQKNWTDQNGASRTSFEVVVRDFTFIDTKAENSKNSASQNSGSTDVGINSEDDLPF